MGTTAKRIDRPLEWFLAGFSVFWGVTTHFSLPAPAQTCPPPLQMFDAAIWATIATGLGLAHMAGLMINGTMSWTPLARLVVTSLNAGFFAWVSSVLAIGPDGESGMMYGYATLGFVWCAYAAGQDVARMRLGTYGL
jgi:hypothetical protein